MTLLLENPLPIVFVGIALEAVLGVVFVNTRRGLVVLAMIGVLLLVLGGVALEWAIVTPKEEVEATLDGVADTLEANDLSRLLSDYIHPDAGVTRSRAAFALGLVEVSRAKMNSLEVTVNKLTSPPSAEARFRGVVYFRSKVEQIPYDYYTAEFTVELRQQGDRWLITNHAEKEGR